MIGFDPETRRKSFFRYPPPMDELSYAEIDEGRRNQNNSVYYLWWAYLRENEDYWSCCEIGGDGPMAELYRDFGDVRNNSFRAWWTTTGWGLFCEPDREPIVDHREVPDAFDPSTHKLVSIPFVGDLDRTLAELRELLKEHFAEARQRLKEKGNPERSPLVPLYPVASRPDCESLAERLAVWQHFKLNRTADPLQIAKDLGLFSKALFQIKDDDYEGVLVRRIRNYIREAEILIHNVGRGRFPDFEDNRPETLQRRARLKASKERRRRLERMSQKAAKP